MIPVSCAPEPPSFDVTVRRPGYAWLAARSIDPNGHPPKASDLPPYWQSTGNALWQAYAGVCAYLAIYFEWALGASSTDHFVAKSKHAGRAYEWTNYRLSCLGTNRSKNRFDDVLDPFLLKPQTFHLNLVTGRIMPNPYRDMQEILSAKNTIRRLKLNSPEHKRMRARHFSEYIRHRDADLLKFYSPFVWAEAQRLDLL